MIFSEIRRSPELTGRKLRLDVQYRRPRRIVKTDINEPPRTIPLDDYKVSSIPAGFGFEIISRDPVHVLTIQTILFHFLLQVFRSKLHRSIGSRISWNNAAIIQLHDNFSLGLILLNSLTFRQFHLPKDLARTLNATLRTHFIRVHFQKCSSLAITSINIRNSVPRPREQRVFSRVSSPSSRNVTYLYRLHRVRNSYKFSLSHFETSKL